MKTYNYKYINEEELKYYINTNFKVEDRKKEILIQIFTAIASMEYIQSLLDILNELLPKVKIIGATTSGEIINGKSIEDSVILSFSIFNTTTIDTTIISHEIDNEISSFKIGETIIENHIKDDTKVMILFTDCINTLANELLDGINSVNRRDIIISGGVAGTFDRSYIFNEKEITSNGVVFATLNNHNLNIFTHYNSAWVPVGKKMIITKSIKNIVYKIDDRTAWETYKYYLNIDIRNNLLEYALEFPLIIEDNKNLKARTPIKCFDDGSIQFAGNITEGKQVSLAYGNIDLAIKNSKKTSELLSKTAVESIFVYSCIARKRLLGSFIDMELSPLDKIAPVSGFFTYGEFFLEGDDCQLLNESMSILAISESTDISINSDIENPKRDFRKNRTLNALTHLINTSTKELQDEIEENRIKEKLLAHQSKLASMGEMVENIAHQWRQPLSTLSGSIQNITIAYNNGMLTKEFLEKQNARAIEVAGYMSNTINDFRNFFSNKDTLDEFFVEDVILKIIKMLELTFLNYNINIILKNKNDEKHLCISDMGSVTQVLLNLIFNSKDELQKLTSKVKNIIISVSEDLFYYKIEVSDNGTGISRNIIEKIFDPYFTTKDTGTGIGLFMSYQIAKERLGGEITCNKVKEGASFTFSFLKELK